MRTALVIALMLSLSFAGCLGSDGIGTDGTSTGSTSEKAGAHDDNLTEKPDKRFEPELHFMAEEPFVDKGDTIRLTYEITDLHDYQYPSTFIDWNVIYDGEPNPVDEGDASELPGSYERVVHRDGYHNFTFFVDDGQGFKENETVSVWLGPVPEPEDDGSDDGGDDGGSDGATTETVEMSIDESILTVSSCSHVCNQFAAEKSAGYPGPFPCVGLSAGENGVDCAFVELSPGAAGSAFTVESDFPLNDPEVMFMETCATDSPYAGESINGGPESGVIPEGAGCLVTWEYAGVASTLTIHVDPWLETVTTGGDGGSEEEGPAYEDRGDYLYDPATGHCHAKSYDEVVPGILYTQGLWVFAETNLVPGLQLEQNNPSPLSQYGGLDDCQDGDQLVF